MIAKTLLRSVLAATVIIAPLAAASANQPQQIAVPQIAVPNPIAIPVPVPTPSYVGGWQISQAIYGPYYVTFNLSQYGGGSYQVSGGGIYCNGSLNWTNYGSSVGVQLHYSHCGNGVDWTGDYLSCSWANYGAPYQWIRCDYYPAVNGFSPVSVLAHRIY